MGATRGNRPRIKAGESACLVCGQRRGEVLVALIGRVREHTIWLCAGCAEREGGRRAFIDDYARQRGLPGDDEGGR